MNNNIEITQRLEFQTFIDEFFGVKGLLSVTQAHVEEYAATTDKLVFVCDLCNVMVSEYDDDDGLHGDVQAFVDAVEDELIRRAPTRFVVEVRATDRTWFSAVEAEGARTPSPRT